MLPNAEESSFSDALLFATMCIVGLPVDVHVSNGSVYSGIFHTASVEGDSFASLQIPVSPAEISAILVLLDLLSLIMYRFMLDEQHAISLVILPRDLMLLMTGSLAIQIRRWDICDPLCYYWLGEISKYVYRRAERWSNFNRIRFF